MNAPVPHGFSRSPVEQVTCSWHSFVLPGCPFGEESHGTVVLDESGGVSIRFDAPYPGWKAITEKLHEVLTRTAGGGGTISRCRLVFSDRFILFSGDVLPSLFSVSHFFPDLAERDRLDKPVVFVGPSAVPHTTNEISLRCNYPAGCEVILRFHLYLESDPVLSIPNALLWFDAAHAEIHHLFDQIVTDTMRERLI